MIRREQVCPVCRHLFRPSSTRPQLLCSLRCKHRWHSARLRGQIPQAAVAAKKAKARKRVEASIRSTFGILSDREVAIFEAGRKVGYAVGYFKAYHARRKAA